MPLNSFTGALGRKRAAHLLRRACFSGSVSDIDTLAGLTAQEAVDLLIRDDLPQPPLPTDASGNEWISGLMEGDEAPDYDRLLNQWMVGQILAAGVPDDQKLSYSFRERLVFFFHTHFTTKISVVRDPRAVYFQNQLFRFYAFDKDDTVIPSGNPDIPDTTYPVNFKQLTKKICLDNAMLIFLDGRLNVAGNPNENYARELLELYAIGKGLEGSVPEPQFDGDYAYFTEQDVQAGARVLSGFVNDEDFLTIDPETNLPRGVARGGITAGSHDNSSKEFSQYFGNTELAPDPNLMVDDGVGGTRPATGEERAIDEINRMVDLIYDQSQTPIYICRKIYRFFVYHQVSPALESDIIQEMADIFVANEFKIIPVLEALFTSEHFYEGDPGYPDDNFGSIIKSPLDLVIGFNKTFEVPTPAYDTNIVNFLDLTDTLLGFIDQQGMNFYEPFEVAGYPAYHQFPIFNRNWIAPNYLLNRYSFIGDRIPLNQDILMGRVDILLFVQDNIPPATARIAKDLVISLAEYLLPVSENLSFDTDTGELTTERLNYFLTRLFSSQMDMDPEAAWTNDWDSQADPEKLRGQLTDLINAMLQSPEYQLM